MNNYCASITETYFRPSQTYCYIVFVKKAKEDFTDIDNLTWKHISIFSYITKYKSRAE